MAGLCIYRRGTGLGNCPDLMAGSDPGGLGHRECQFKIALVVRQCNVIPPWSAFGAIGQDYHLPGDETSAGYPELRAPLPLRRIKGNGCFGNHQCPLCQGAVMAFHPDIVAAGGDIQWDGNDKSEVASAAHLHPGIVTNNLYVPNPN